jgi:hypothetical protein
MTIEVGTLKTIAEIVALAVLFYGYFSKVTRFVDRQKEQDKELKSIKSEQAILTYGVLACLKGLREQGCDGPVTEAISKIEKYLNQAAHE